MKYPCSYCWHEAKTKPSVAILSVAAGTLVGQLARRRLWDEALFNISQTSLQVAVAAFIMRSAGWEPGAAEYSEPEFIFAIAVAGLVVFVVNNLLVGGIVSTQAGVDPFEIWIMSIVGGERFEYLGHLSQVGLGVTAAVLAERLGPGTPPRSARPIAELSLVMPAYNEEAGIRAVLAEARSALAARCARFEIVVVDDGSTDATGELLARATTATEIVVLTHSRNLGYSAALSRGLRAARYDPVLYTDSDGQFDLADLDRALPLAGQRLEVEPDQLAVRRARPGGLGEQRDENGRDAVDVVEAVRGLAA